MKDTRRAINMYDQSVSLRARVIPYLFAWLIVIAVQWYFEGQYLALRTAILSAVYASFLWGVPRMERRSRARRHVTPKS